MKSTIALAACLLLTSIGNISHATLAFETPPLMSHAIGLRATDKITGSVAVIQAYQAIVEKNASNLLQALSATPSPLNESLTLFVNGTKLKLRLIHVAVLNKDPITIGLLVKFGARTGSKDSLGRTAAHYASFGAPDFGTLFNFASPTDSDAASAILEFLYFDGANLDALDKTLRTPLHYAAMTGDTGVVNRLLGMGASVDPIDAFGFTPRQLAIRSGFHFSVAHTLGTAGSTAPVTSTDYLVGIKNRALSYAIMYPFISVGVGLVSLSALISQATLPSSPENEHDEDKGSDENPMPQIDLGIRQAPLVLNGGSLAGAVAIPVQATKAQTKTRNAGAKSANVNQIVARRPVAAVAPKTAVVTHTKRLNDATDDLNSARRLGDEAKLLAAIKIAKTLLVEFNGADLNDNERSSRRHLVAALHSISKLKNISPRVLSKVSSLLLTYGKYREQRH